MPTAPTHPSIASEFILCMHLRKGAGFGLLQLFMAQFVYLWFRSSTVVAFTQQQKVLLLMLVRILATSFRLLPIELRWRSGLGGLAQRGQRLQD